MTSKRHDARRRRASWRGIAPPSGVGLLDVIVSQIRWLTHIGREVPPFGLKPNSLGSRSGMLIRIQLDYVIQQDCVHIVNPREDSFDRTICIYDLAYVINNSQDMGKVLQLMESTLQHEEVESLLAKLESLGLLSKTGLQGVGIAVAVNSTKYAFAVCDRRAVVDGSESVGDDWLGRLDTATRVPSITHPYNRYIRGAETRRRAT